VPDSMPPEFLLEPRASRSGSATSEKTLRMSVGDGDMLFACGLAPEGKLDPVTDDVVGSALRDQNPLAIGWGRFERKAFFRDMLGMGKGGEEVDSLVLLVSIRTWESRRSSKKSEGGPWRSGPRILAESVASHTTLLFTARQTTEDLARKQACRRQQRTGNPPGPMPAWRERE